jgi:hypothetical protein
MNVYNSHGETSCKVVICSTEDIGEQLYVIKGEGNGRIEVDGTESRTCSMASFGISDVRPTGYAVSQLLTLSVVWDYRSQK